VKRHASARCGMRVFIATQSASFDPGGVAGPLRHRESRIAQGRRLFAYVTTFSQCGKAIMIRGPAA